MAKTFRVGIVGCGGISRAHLAAWNENGAEVRCVYDIHGKAASAFAKEAGGADVEASLNKMAKRDDIDAVSICTPPGVHLENCRPFLKTKVPILCEKPLELDAARAARLATAVKKSRTPFMVAFCHRFHPAVVKLKELIAKGKLGRIQYFQNIFAGTIDMRKNHRACAKVSGGGVMADNGCHAADLFRFLVGDPVRVSAEIADHGQHMKVEDFALLRLETAKKAFGEIVVSWSMPVGANRITVYGDKGTGIVSYFDPSHPDLSICLANENKWKTVSCTGLPQRIEGEVKHFMDCVRKKRKPAVSVDDGVCANRIITAGYKSAKEGRRIALPKR